MRVEDIIRFRVPYAFDAMGREIEIVAILIFEDEISIDNGYIVPHDHAFIVWRAPMDIGNGNVVLHLLPIGAPAKALKHIR